MRVTGIPIVVLAAMLGLASGGAVAQSSEDEQILETVPVDEGTDSAPPSDEELDEQVFYSGFGVGRAESDFANLGEAINLDIVLGFRIPTVPWFGIELDIAQTIIPGENTRSSGSSATNCGGVLQPPCPETETVDRDEFHMQALGLSAAFKSTGRFYVMGRYGYRYIATSINELNENRSGTGFGAGVGYRWGRGLSGVELSYQELSDQVDALNLVFFARFNR